MSERTSFDRVAAWLTRDHHVKFSTPKSLAKSRRKDVILSRSNKGKRTRVGSDRLTIARLASLLPLFCPGQYLSFATPFRLARRRSKDDIMDPFRNGTRAVSIRPFISLSDRPRVGSTLTNATSLRRLLSRFPGPNASCVGWSVCTRQLGAPSKKTCKVPRHVCTKEGKRLTAMPEVKKRCTGQCCATAFTPSRHCEFPRRASR